MSKGLELRGGLQDDRLALRRSERVPAPPVDGPHLVERVPALEGDRRIRHALLIACRPPRLKPRRRAAYSDRAMRTFLSWLSSIVFLPVFGLTMVVFDVAQR